MKLAVPDMISNSYFPVLAAVELGFFRKEGLDMHLELMSPADKAYGALREGDVDFVGAEAHSALAVFPEWRSVKLLCAQSQGMHWFLVMRADLGARRGDVEIVRGRRIGAAPWVELAARALWGSNYMCFAPAAKVRSTQSSQSFVSARYPGCL
jgi:NitT/TauT family transport system substrate-binding protein